MTDVTLRINEFNKSNDVSLSKDFTLKDRKKKKKKSVNLPGFTSGNALMKIRLGSYSL